MRLIVLLTTAVLWSSCTAKPSCGNYQFYGKVSATKSSKLYLQVFPNDKRMYRLWLAGKKLRWAKFIGRPVSFQGNWDGDKKTPAMAFGDILIASRKDLSKGILRRKTFACPLEKMSK